MRLNAFSVLIIIFRAEKDRQQLIVEVDNLTTLLDGSNKAKVRLTKYR